MTLGQITCLLILIQEAASIVRNDILKEVRSIKILNLIKIIKRYLKHKKAEVIQKIDINLYIKLTNKLLVKKLSHKIVLKKKFFILQYINLANITRLLIVLKPCLFKKIKASFIEFKKIFKENSIDVKEDISRCHLLWRNKSCYS